MADVTVTTTTTTPKMSLLDKIKVLFTAKKALDQINAGPKSSFFTGEFWAKVAAGACVMWAGVHGFVPEPLATYITVGLALWVSVERLYLKMKHLDATVDLSKAPALDINQFTQVMSDLVAKFPKLEPIKAPVIEGVQVVIDKTNEPVVQVTEPAK